MPGLPCPPRPGPCGGFRGFLGRKIFLYFAIRPCLPPAQTPRSSATGPQIRPRCPRPCRRAWAAPLVRLPGFRLRTYRWPAGPARRRGLGKVQLLLFILPGGRLHDGRGDPGYGREVSGRQPGGPGRHGQGSRRRAGGPPGRLRRPPRRGRLARSRPG